MESRKSRIVVAISTLAAILLSASCLVAGGRVESVNPEQKRQESAPVLKTNEEELRDGGYSPIEINDPRAEDAAAYLQKELNGETRILRIHEACIQVVAGYKIRLRVETSRNAETKNIEAVIYYPPGGPPQLLKLVE